MSNQKTQHQEHEAFKSRYVSVHCQMRRDQNLKLCEKLGSMNLYFTLEVKALADSELPSLHTRDTNILRVLQK
jgi:hypothetical protein